MAEDDDIREGLRADDHRGFRLLLERHGEAMYAVCFKVLHDRSAADDALQDAFARIWRKRHKVAAAESVRAYVHKVAKHAAIDVVRKARRRRDLDRANPTAPEAGVTDVGAAGPDRATLVALTECLEPVEAATRTAVFMQFNQGQSWKAIAAAVELPVDTIRMRVKRVMSDLLACLKGKGVLP